MKKTRIFINGFGRIGRHCAKIISADKSMQIVAINDLYPKKQMLELFAHDSIYGSFDKTVLNHVEFFNQKDPKDINFEDLDIDLLLQCSGVFLDQKSNNIYIQKGVKKVIISAPAIDDTPVFIQGVNEHTYNNQAILSASSCSANAIVPIAWLIDKYLDIKALNVSMIHSYTADQNLLDVKHKTRDIRRIRSATQNILPLYSSASYAVSKVMPKLKDKIIATSIRVPVSHCTLYDFTIKTKKDITTKALHELFINSPLKVLDTTTKELVSNDFISNPFSAVIDLPFTQARDKNLIHINAWQDNEYAYAKRLVSLAKYCTQSSNILQTFS